MKVRKTHLGQVVVTKAKDEAATCHRLITNGQHTTLAPSPQTIDAVHAATAMTTVHGSSPMNQSQGIMVSPVTQVDGLHQNSVKTDMILSNVHLVSALQSPIIWPADGILRQVIMVGELGTNQIILTGPGLEQDVAPAANDIDVSSCKQLSVETARADLERSAPNLLVIENQGSAFETLGSVNAAGNGPGEFDLVQVGGNSGSRQVVKKLTKVRRGGRAAASLQSIGDNLIALSHSNAAAAAASAGDMKADDLPPIQPADLYGDGPAHADDGLGMTDHPAAAAAAHDEMLQNLHDEVILLSRQNSVPEVEHHSSDGNGELGYTAHLLSQLSGTGALPTMSSSQVSSVLSALEPADSVADKPPPPSAVSVPQQQHHHHHRSAANIVQPSAVVIGNGKHRKMVPVTVNDVSSAGKALTVNDRYGFVKVEGRSNSPQAMSATTTTPSAVLKVANASKLVKEASGNVMVAPAANKQHQLLTQAAAGSKPAVATAMATPPPRSAAAKTVVVVLKEPSNGGKISGVFKCASCEYMSSNESSVEAHAEREHGSADASGHAGARNGSAFYMRRRLIRCVGCENVFYSKHALQVHLIQDHRVCANEIAAVVSSIVQPITANDLARPQKRSTADAGEKCKTVAVRVEAPLSVPASATLTANLASPVLERSHQSRTTVQHQSQPQPLHSQRGRPSQQPVFAPKPTQPSTVITSTPHGQPPPPARSALTTSVEPRLQPLTLTATTTAAISNSASIFSNGSTYTESDHDLAEDMSVVASNKGGGGGDEDSDEDSEGVDGDVAAINDVKEQESKENDGLKDEDDPLTGIPDPEETTGLRDPPPSTLSVDDPVTASGKLGSGSATLGAGPVVPVKPARAGCESQSSTSSPKKRGRPKGAQTMRAVKFKSGSTPSTVKIEKDQTIRCGVDGCAVRLQSESNMTYHRKCHLQEGGDSVADALLACPECRITSSQWTSLTFHLWKAHDIDMELYSCAQCGYKTNSYSKLVNLHSRIHGDERPFLCDLCGKGFKTPKQLRNHKTMHKNSAATGNDSQPMSCNICGRKVSDARNLRLHTENVHNKRRPFHCFFCGYSTASRSSLIMHSRQHTGEKPFKCEECDYATADHNSLRRHKMQHSGNKPYSCPHCTYACIQSTTYKVHLKRKHPGLEEGLMFNCPDCPFHTVKEDNFLAHKAQHKVSGGAGAVGGAKRQLRALAPLPSTAAPQSSSTVSAGSMSSMPSALQVSKRNGDRRMSATAVDNGGVVATIDGSGQVVVSMEDDSIALQSLVKHVSASIIPSDRLETLINADTPVDLHQEPTPVSLKVADLGHGLSNVSGLAHGEIVISDHLNLDDSDVESMNGELIVAETQENR